MTAAQAIRQAHAGSRPREAGDAAGLPEALTAERRIALCLFLATFAYLLLFRRFTAMDPDEGIVLQGAQRILRGELPYRDFFTFYTPGSYYLTALLFELFGSSLLVARLALALFGGIFTCVHYLLARRVCSRGNALLVAALIALTTLPFRFMALHNWDSTLWTCLALYAAVRLLESRTVGWAFATGSFASLTLMFEQSKGVGLWLGLGAAWLALAVTQRSEKRWDARQAGAVLAGGAWPVLLGVGYFAAEGALPQMLADLLWPLQHYSLANRVPYGYLNWSEATRQMIFHTGSWDVRLIKLIAVSPVFVVPVLPLIGLACLALWLVRSWRQQLPAARSAYYVVCGGAMAGLLLSVVVVRADIIHFMYLLPVFGLVLGWLLDGVDLPWRAYQAVRPVFKTYAVIAFLAFGMPPLFASLKAPAAMQTARGSITTPQADEVIGYTQAHAGAGEAILVYPYLPLYYFLTGTVSPSRYEFFQPGMNTPEQAQEIVADLQTRQVRLVLYDPTFTQKIANAWPQASRAALLEDPVTHYLQQNYRLCTTLKSATGSDVQVLLRNDLACQ